MKIKCTRCGVAVASPEDFEGSPEAGLKFAGQFECRMARILNLAAYGDANNRSDDRARLNIGL